MSGPKGPKNRPTSGRREARARAKRAAARRPLTTRMVVALGVAFVVGLLILATRGGGADGVTDPNRFDLPRLGHTGRVRLAAYRGKPLVVNFFASWCTACDAELPGFARVSKELKGDVAFVGVNALETGDPLYMPRRHGITWWRLARDVGGRNGSGLHDALGGQGMPITAFYDAGGSLIDRAFGAIDEEQLRDQLRRLYDVRV